MVQKIPDRDEAIACDEFRALLSNTSRQVGEHAGFPIWECKVNQRPQATGYWIGCWTGCLPEFYSFLVVEPITLVGRESALEAVRGWSDPEHRGERLFSTLLRTAAQVEGKSLVSDRDGMTESAHVAWIHASGFSRTYFDMEENQMVEVENVPQEDRFTCGAQGRRWLLVLNPI